MIETSGEPIRNPVTGAAHRARVVLPHGFEYTEAEFASTTTRTSGGPIALEWVNGHGHFCTLDLTPNGPPR